MSSRDPLLVTDWRVAEGVTGVSRVANRGGDGNGRRGRW